MQRALAWNHMLRLSKHIKATASMQLAVFVVEKLLVSDSALLSDDPHRVFQEAKIFEPKLPTAIRRVKDDARNPAATLEDQQRFFENICRRCWLAKP